MAVVTKSPGSSSLGHSAPTSRLGSTPQADRADDGFRTEPADTTVDSSTDTSDDEGDESAGRSALRPQNMAEKKRCDNAAFGAFVEKNREKWSKADIKAPEDYRVKSAARMFRDIEGTKIIESPRDYQVELFERAKEKNTIAVLDTGNHQWRSLPTEQYGS